MARAESRRPRFLEVVVAGLLAATALVKFSELPPTPGAHLLLLISCVSLLYFLPRIGMGLLAVCFLSPSTWTRRIKSGISWVFLLFLLTTVLFAWLTDIPARVRLARSESQLLDLVSIAREEADENGLYFPEEKRFGLVDVHLVDVKRNGEVEIHTRTEFSHDSTAGILHVAPGRVVPLATPHRHTRHIRGPWWRFHEGHDVDLAVKLDFDFLGRGVVADGTYFVVDRSGSMQDSGELRFAKQAIVETIEQLPAGSEVAVIFSDAGIQRFPASESPLVLTDGTRKEIVAWILSIDGGAESCPATAFSAALDYVDNASATRNAIIYIGDGGGTCLGQNERSYLQDMVREVTAMNNARAEIHTFGVLMENRGAFFAQLLGELAESNGGRHFDVAWP